MVEEACVDDDVLLPMQATSDGSSYEVPVCRYVDDIADEFLPMQVPAVSRERLDAMGALALMMSKDAVHPLPPRIGGNDILSSVATPPVHHADGERGEAASDAR